MKLRVEMYAQDGCSVCEEMKNIYGLVDKTTTEVNGVKMFLIYNNDKIINMGYKHIPVTFILKNKEIVYREFGVFNKGRLKKYLEVLKNGGALVSNIKK